MPISLSVKQDVLLAITATVILFFKILKTLPSLIGFWNVSVEVINIFDYLISFGL